MQRRQATNISAGGFVSKRMMKNNEGSHVKDILLPNEKKHDKKQTTFQT